MKKVAFVVTALAALAASPSFAADLPTKAPVMVAPAPVAEPRWYLEGRFGFPLRQNYDVTVTPVGTGTYEPDSGWYGALAAGLQWHPNWRAELTLSYATGSDGVAFGLAHSGRVNIWTIALNGYYVFTNWGPIFQPFVGVGIGVAMFDVDGLGATAGAFSANGSDSTLAAALHLGADYYLTRSIALTGRYTLAYTGDISVSNSPAGFGTSSRDATFDHIFSAGFRFYLN